MAAQFQMTAAAVSTCTKSSRDAEIYFIVNLWLSLLWPNIYVIIGLGLLKHITPIWSCTVKKNHASQGIYKPLLYI